MRFFKRTPTLRPVATLYERGDRVVVETCAFWESMGASTPTNGLVTLKQPFTDEELGSAVVAALDAYAAVKDGNKEDRELLKAIGVTSRTRLIKESASVQVSRSGTAVSFLVMIGHPPGGWTSDSRPRTTLTSPTADQVGAAARDALDAAPVLSQESDVVQDRRRMEAALRSAINEHLRPEGFRGSLPHLRRPCANRIELVTFQWFSSSGSFVVEVASCPPDGFTTSSGTHIAPNKVTAHDVSHPRLRLGSDTFPEGDHWFSYGRRSYEAPGPSVGPERFDEIAAEVVRLIHDQAQPFWAGLAR